MNRDVEELSEAVNMMLGADEAVGMFVVRVGVKGTVYAVGMVKAAWNVY